MSMNLLDMLQNQLSGELISKASQFLGESESNTQSAMGAALPAIMGSLIQKGSNESGASGIMDILSAGNFDGSMLGNLGNLFGGGDATNGLVNSGGSILKSLLGNNLGSVVGLISSLTGIGKGSSSSLLSMAAPLVMSMIGKQVGGKGVSGLMSLLASQSDFVKDAMPAGMGSLLGFADMGSSMKDMGDAAMKSAGSTVKRSTETATAAVEEGGSMMGNLLKWGIPLVAIAGLLYYFMGSGTVDQAANIVKETTEKAKEGVSAAGEVVGEAASTVADAAGDAANKAGEVAGDAANAVSNAAESAVDATMAAAAKALEGVKFAAGSVGAKFSEFLATGKEDANATFAFNNLTFASNSATINEASMSEIDNLASVLKAYTGIHIEIGGHTDNTGNAEGNKALSLKRAEAVKARLIAQGIAADRISTMGYGAANPVADNNTDEGKKQNRRIEIKITKR